MRLEKKCVTCVLNQIIRVAGIAGLSPELTDRVYHSALRRAREINTWGLTSPEFAGYIYRVFSEISGVTDPYKALRKEQNDMVLQALDYFKRQIDNAHDPLYTAGLLALLGNIIDYGGVEIFDVRQVFKGFDHLELIIDDYKIFQEKLLSSRQVLIIGDNAGEAVFDRLFIEEIKKCHPGVSITYGVRSGPAINDVLIEDACYIGLDKVCRVMETGAHYAGTVISRASSQFRAAYDQADLVISKGQGNYETLEEEDREILFIFKVKCPVVADYSGIPLGSSLFAYPQSLSRFKPTKIPTS